MSFESRKISPARCLALKADAEEREVVFENLAFLQLTGFLQESAGLKPIFPTRANFLLEFSIGARLSIRLDNS